MGNTLDEKAALRRDCRQVRASIRGEERTRAEEKILCSLSAMPGFCRARLLLFYMPVRDEVNVKPLMLSALRAGREVALPRCEDEPGKMTFRRVRSESDLASGAFGVPEPSKDAPVVTEEELKCADVCALVPGLAFDKRGYRLGYGKGYYDRFLSAFGGISVGVCFEKLIFDALPSGLFDRRVSAVVSEREVRITDA